MSIREPSYHATQFPIHSDVPEIETISIIHSGNEIFLLFNTNCVLQASLPQNTLLEDDCFMALVSACDGNSASGCVVKELHYTEEVDRERLAGLRERDHEMVEGREKHDL